MRKFRVIALMALASAVCAPALHAAGGGSMSMPAPAPQIGETPEQKAKRAYNAGVKLVKRADKQQERDAAKAADAYRKALGKFEEALGHEDSMPEAWNYAGYAKRKLGDFDGALAAYDRALSLRPDFAEAMEYRGQAYLGLNRVEEAKQAYLSLFAGNRKLSEQLLAAMRQWIETQRASGGGNGAVASELEQWVNERTTIASQTAALTREGSDSSWR